MQPRLLLNSVKNTKSTDFHGFSSETATTRPSLLPSLKAFGWAGAFGSLFIFAQTYAISLQNMQVNSALGEPLDAIVMVNAAPGEVLQASCMRTAANADSGMPAIRGVQLSLSRKLSPGTLRLTTPGPVNEPMSEIVVHIDCAGAPAVKRSFLVMLDPRGVMNARTSSAALSTTTSAASISSSARTDGSLYSEPLLSTSSGTNPVVTSTDNRINVRSRQVTVFRGAPIDPGADYVVVNGDALSTIAARVTGRDYGTVWSWAATIQGANPHAFINGNPNELIAGSKLYVPTTLAAGTAGLTVPDNRSTAAASAAAAAAAAAAMSRYQGRFSTSTLPSSPDSEALASNETPTPETGAEPAGLVTRQPAATGSVRAIQPVMVMATSFSGISRERLRQRQRGLIQAAPNNLPNFASESSSAGPQGSNPAASAGEPAPQDNQTPTQPVVAKPEAIAANSESRFSWLSVLAGIGLLLSTFFAGWWLSRRRAEAEMEEAIEARLNEERYRARVRSGRQDVIRASMGGLGAGIQVTESNDAAAAKDTSAAELSENDIDEVLDAALNDRGLIDDDATGNNVNAAGPITDNDSPMIDHADLEIDHTQGHELADIDLELLERDYASQTETNTGLEEIASAGRGTDPAIKDLNMEFPEEVRLKNSEEPAFDTLEFDARSGSIDFDVGADVGAEEEDKTEALGFDLEEAGATIDAHLEQLQREDDETESLDATSEVEMQSFPLSSEIDDLVIENLIDDEQMQPDSQDEEDFYHLEASSIMNVGELDFEKGPDDETNILRFRQRNIRTGTDDSTGEDE